MYRVVRYFTDLQDNNYAYNAGDKFPRDGMEVTNERINELLSNENKQHTQLIQFVDDEEVVDAVSEETVAYTEDTLSEMTTREIKTLAAELGYRITRNSKSDVIEQFLNQQNG